ncbi:uncharacterized protein LOC128371565 [Scomber japonicus]|uniref:uncharacterized protein LOC128371565 n=1 Tax=Scomber japonicus TaxID=13676 RepID=UPI002305E128|nr:uncharacterized protein LOC128371565 [Scomber japonicus]
MKGPNILLLLYCIETLMVLLCGADVYPTNIEPETAPPEKQNLMTQNAVQETTPAASTMTQTTASTMTQTTASNTSTIAASEASYSTSSESTVIPNDQSTPKYRVSNPPPPTTTITKHDDKLYKPECLREFVVAGGLIILCAVLLISTVSLTCKVCQLSRHIKKLKRRDSETISNSGYLTGTPMKEKSKSETEAIETTVLMADVSQTQEEVGNSGTKEEEEKVINDGQMGEEKDKEPGDTAETSTGENEKETLVISDENPSSPNLQEETADSQSAKAVAASSSEGTEEPKDVV